MDDSQESIALENVINDVILKNDTEENDSDITQDISDNVDSTESVENDVIDNKDVLNDSETEDGTKKDLNDKNNDDDDVVIRELSNFSRNMVDAIKAVKDPEQRQILINESKRMRLDYDTKLGQLGKDRKISQAFQESIKEYDLGYNDDNAPQVIKNLLQFDSNLIRQPKETIKNLVNQLGIDPADLLENNHSEDGYSNDSDYDYRTPEEKNLQKLQAEIEHLKNYQQQQQIAQQQQYYNKAYQEALDFKNATDKDGNLLHPHVDKVGAKMDSLLKMDEFKDKSYEEVYQTAVLLDPDLRSIRDNELLQKANQERKNKIAQAKKNQKYTNWNDRSVKADIDTLLMKEIEKYKQEL